MTREPPDDPIEPFQSGGMYVAEVIDLAGIRLRRGRSTTPFRAQCEHRSLTFCQTERRVWCDDCRRTLDNFDALVVIAGGLEKMVREATSRLHKADEAMKSTLNRRASKEVDRVWSGHGRAMSCPHCHGGILPEDVANGVSWSSREYEMARRKAATPTKEPPDADRT